MSLKVNRNQVNLVQRKGMMLFKPFWAEDKYRNPIKIRYDNNTGKSVRIVAANEYGCDFGEYHLNFLKDERTIFSPLLHVYEGFRNRGIGELLTFAGLIELRSNFYNISLFSLKRTMGFPAKIGFKLDTDKVYYILDDLKFVKNKAKINPETARDAAFFYPQVKSYCETQNTDPDILQHAANVISNYMKEVMRHGRERYMPNYPCGCEFKFTDWELLVEKNYLNHLLEKHRIDYRF